MEERTLGDAVRVPAIGLGCMGMSEFYGRASTREAVRTIQRALDLGVTLLDTADVYGLGANERLVGRALAGRRDAAIVATKFGHVRSRSGEFLGVNGHPEYVRLACEASLRRLTLDWIDLYQQHRVDPAVPIEETVGAMRDLVVEGKVRHIGLSEAHPQDIRRAAAVAAITSVQSEYALFTRDVERNGVLDCCEELSIGFLAYAPLGRGLLARRFSARSEIDPTDTRLTNRYARFEPDNWERNVHLTRTVDEVARRHGATAAQVSLAWLLSRRPFVVPIPGTKRRRYLEENAAAVALWLSQDDLVQLDGVPTAVGARQSKGDPLDQPSPPLS